MPPKLKHFLTALMCFAGAGCTPASKAPSAHAPAGNERWAVYYDKELPAEAFQDYDLVVFDRIYHPELAPLKGKTVLLSYISLGEVHGDSDEYAILSAQNAVMGKRTKWNSYATDITSLTWANMVLAQVENAMEQGFDGVMLDTTDSALHMADMESQEKGEKAQEAAITLVKSMRQRFPGMKIMLNRAFEILPRVAKTIDYALGESILTDLDVSSGQSVALPATTYQSTAFKLLEARKFAPDLKIYTLDYWNQDDIEGIQKLYAIQRAHGFNPYITTPDLRRHTPEPAGQYQHTYRQEQHLGDRSHA